MKNNSIKVLYVEALKKIDKTSIFPDFSTTSDIPRKIFLAYIIQYKNLAFIIKKKLEENGFKISGFSQVLGCSKLNSKEPILLIGGSRFHAINLALRNSESTESNLFSKRKPIYIYDNAQISKIEEKEIQSFLDSKIASFSKFLHSSNVGIIISTKPGQQEIAKALKLKQLVQKKYKKNAFLFASNNLNLNELENFCIDFWINTSCIGLFIDSLKLDNQFLKGRFLNAEDLSMLEKYLLQKK